MTRVRIIEQLVEDAVHVYVSSVEAGGNRRAFFREGRMAWEDDPTPAGARMEPTLVLRTAEYEALRKAMIGEALDRDDALQDTRGVRDRLLALVEQAWEARP